MSQLISFQDAVTGANLDPKQTHAVYYFDGKFANKAAVAARCPHAKLYGITVLGTTGVGIFAIDSETGDVPVAGTLAWLEKQIKLGVHKVHPICAYANESRWLNEGLLTGVLALEKKYGVQIEKWDAHYDGIAKIPSWASAKQYADPGPIDRNVALANFFGDVIPPAVHEWSAELQVSVPHGSTGKLRVITTVDLSTGKWTTRSIPGVAHFSGHGGGKWRVKGLPLDSKPLGR